MEVQIDNTKIILKRNEAYPWFNNKRIWIKGYGFHNNILYKNDELLNYFKDGNNVEKAISLVRDLDGFFSVIIVMDNGIFAAVDHLRSMPLFYKKTGKSFVVSDFLDDKLIKKNQLNNDAIHQFESTLFVVGNKTLLKDVFQICSGSYVFINKCGVEKQKEYWTYHYEIKNEISDSNLAKKIIKSAYEDTFKRMIKFLAGSKAVIPLSGGHDSRLIIYYLKKLGYKNIITYTYGIKGNEESKVAKKVAEVLDVPHYFVEYKRSKTVRFYKDLFKEFAYFCGNCVSVPHIQEFYAVKWLLNNNIIDKQSIIIPGFTGDFLTGAHLIPSHIESYEYTKKQLIEDIFFKFYNESKSIWGNIKIEERQKLNSSIISCEYINALPECFPSFKAAEVFERFNLMERQAKFIQNAVRTYEFWGIKWATPLFEKEQFNVWMKISNKLRFNRNLFFEFEKKEYPLELKNIKFARSTQEILGTKFIRYLKYIYPHNYHFLYTHIPFRKYYANLLLKGNLKINQLIKNEYLQEIKKLIKE